jgi:hypothetical protein
VLLKMECYGRCSRIEPVDLWEVRPRCPRTSCRPKKVIASRAATIALTLSLRISLGMSLPCYLLVAGEMKSIFLLAVTLTTVAKITCISEHHESIMEYV